MERIVILGAGLTGLSAAYFLERNGSTCYKLFEKELIAGGLCRSITQDGFTFDMTGHVIHVNNEIFKKFISDTIGFENLIPIERNSWIYSNNVYSRYPFQRNLRDLPVEVIADCIQGFIQRPTHKKKLKTFPDWVNYHFGVGFARHFFLPFQKKNFAYDLRLITADWTHRFVPETSLEQIIEGIKGSSNKNSASYNAHFFYPKYGGMGTWIHLIEKKLQKPINTNMKVIKIDIPQRTVLFENGHYEQYDVLINTLPLDHLLELIHYPSSNFGSVAKKLVCNSVINFNLGINYDQLTDKHWIYFPEKKFPFYRLGFPHNLSAYIAPPSMSSVAGEIAFLKPKKITGSVLAQSIQQTTELLGFSNDAIATQAIITIPRAYVLYDQWRQKNLSKLLDELKEHQIYSIGRYGAWKYASMQESVLDGMMVANELNKGFNTIKPKNFQVTMV